MKIFTTYYLDSNGVKCSGERIKAINWNDAEEQAKMLGLTIVGQLVSDIECDHNYAVDWKNEKIYNTIPLN